MRINPYKGIAKYFSLLLILVVLISAAEGLNAMAESTRIRTEPFFVEDGDERIEGILCLPAEERDSYPTVIVSHGFGGNYRFLTENIARELAENGYAAYTLNFRNPDTRSMLNTSVLTEAKTLSAVVDCMARQPFVDQMFMLGESQGGFVSAYVAATLPEEQKPKALVLYYPAFVLQDDARERHPDYEQEGYTFPETEIVGTNRVSGMYSRDALSFDIFDVIPAYQDDVLIIHGTADSVAPLSYSERAIEVYDHAELITIPDAGHGFYGGSDFETALQETVAFLNDHLSPSGGD